MQIKDALLEWTRFVACDFIYAHNNVVCTWDCVSVRWTECTCICVRKMTTSSPKWWTCVRLCRVVSKLVNQLQFYQQWSLYIGTMNNLYHIWLDNWSLCWMPWRMYITHHFWLLGFIFIQPKTSNLYSVYSIIVPWLFIIVHVGGYILSRKIHQTLHPA